MLENGADVRLIPGMLGHSELKTTQIYPSVSIVNLKQIHTLAHSSGLQRRLEHLQPAAGAQTGPDNANRSGAGMIVQVSLLDG